MGVLYRVETRCVVYVVSDSPQTARLWVQQAAELRVSSQGTERVSIVSVDKASLESIETDGWGDCHPYPYGYGMVQDLVEE